MIYTNLKSVQKYVVFNGRLTIVRISLHIQVKPGMLYTRMERSHCIIVNNSFYRSISVVEYVCLTVIFNFKNTLITAVLTKHCKGKSNGFYYEIS